MVSKPANLLNLFPHRHTPTVAELQTHITNAATDLVDAKNATVSAVGRYKHAYDAAHALAIAAVKIRGFRPSNELGHRQLVFTALEHAVPAVERDVPIFNDAHKERNRSEYDGAPISVTASKLEGLIKAADNLLEEVQYMHRQWLKDQNATALGNVEQPSKSRAAAAGVAAQNAKAATKKS